MINYNLNLIIIKFYFKRWVSIQTNGKINDIMPNIPIPETKTIITSALYFTGEWETPFFVNYTRM
jgi:serine protease inhibitor